MSLSPGLLPVLRTARRLGGIDDSSTESHLSLPVLRDGRCAGFGPGWARSREPNPTFTALHGYTSRPNARGREALRLETGPSDCPAHLPGRQGEGDLKPMFPFARCLSLPALRPQPHPCVPHSCPRLSPFPRHTGACLCAFRLHFLIFALPAHTTHTRMSVRPCLPAPGP